MLAPSRRVNSPWAHPLLCLLTSSSVADKRPYLMLKRMVSLNRTWAEGAAARHTSLSHTAQSREAVNIWSRARAHGA